MNKDETVATESSTQNTKRQMNTGKEITVIVGAGLTGLSVAWKLASSGQDCLLLEQRSTPGGMASTHLLDDIVFDLGPHFIFLDNQSPGGQLINEVIAENEVISQQFRYAIITDTHHFKMPIKGDILRYPFKYKKQILANLLRGSKSSAPPQSLRYFIESRFGKAYYDEVFGTMIQKKTGIDGKDLHLDWYIRPERDFQNNRQILSQTKTKTKRILEPLKTFFFTNHYCYPAKGFGYIADQIFARYENCSGKSVFDCGEIELVCSENSVKSCRVKQHEIAVKDLIWTGSTDTLISLLPGENDALLPQIDTIILLLTFNGKRLLSNQYSYTYYPDKNIIFNRAYCPGNIFKERFPHDKDGICLEINWFNGLASKTEEEIIEKALADVDRLGIFKKNNLRYSHFIRLKKSLPVYGLDYNEQLTIHNRSIRKFKNVYAVGRTGGYFFCMSTAAVNQGIKTADHILALNNVRNNQQTDV